MKLEKKTHSACMGMFINSSSAIFFWLLTFARCWRYRKTHGNP